MDLLREELVVEDGDGATEFGSGDEEVLQWEFFELVGDVALGVDLDQAGC